MREKRCDHGFLRSQAPCKTCDNTDAKRQKQRPHQQRVSDQQIADALNAERSPNRAARSLGITRPALVARAGKQPELKALLDSKTVPENWGTRFSHPGFVDLTGKPMGGAQVISRAENVRGNAHWLCLLSCGHEKVCSGIALRHAEKRGGKVRCDECYTNRPGAKRGVK